MGWLTIAVNIVGTPGMQVGLVDLISFKASSSTKRGMITISAASAIEKFMTTVIANTWKNGSTPIIRCGACAIPAPRTPPAAC